MTTKQTNPSNTIAEFAFNTGVILVLASFALTWFVLSFVSRGDTIERMTKENATLTAKLESQKIISKTQGLSEDVRTLEERRSDKGNCVVMTKHFTADKEGLYRADRFNVETETVKGSCYS